MGGRHVDVLTSLDIKVKNKKTREFDGSSNEWRVRFRLFDKFLEHLHITYISIYIQYILLHKQ